MSRGVETPVIDKSAEDLAPEHLRSDRDQPPEFPRDPFGRGEGGRGQSAVSNARLGMLIFLGAEAMFFAGLIGAFLVFRFGSATWPPPGQPYLPVGLPGARSRPSGHGAPRDDLPGGAGI